MKIDLAHSLILLALAGLASNLLVVKPILFNGSLDSQKDKRLKVNRKLTDEVSKIDIDGGHASNQSDEDTPSDHTIIKGINPPLGSGFQHIDEEAALIHKKLDELSKPTVVEMEEIDEEINSKSNKPENVIKSVIKTEIVVEDDSNSNESQEDNIASKLNKEGVTPENPNEGGKTKKIGSKEDPIPISRESSSQSVEDSHVEPTEDSPDKLKKDSIVKPENLAPEDTGEETVEFKNNKPVKVEKSPDNETEVVATKKIDKKTGEVEIQAVETRKDGKITIESEGQINIVEEKDDKKTKKSSQTLSITVLLFIVGLIMLK